MDKFSPFFDQQSPEIEIDGLIASMDNSSPYELDAMAVFKAGERFLVVAVSACSCWPDYGRTTQTICTTKEEVDRLCVEGWKQLIQSCQDAKWEVIQETKAK